MKSTEFKVHTIYTKDDILQMEKVSTRKLRHVSLWISGVIFALYAATVIWEAAKGEGFSSPFSGISGGVLNVILLGALAICIASMVALPYWRRNKLLKSVPDGILKANYYFYEKTFQYGWGNNYISVAYVAIEEFRDLPNSFFIRTADSAYWVKKSDFTTGTPENFLEYMKGKVKCKMM